MDENSNILAAIAAEDFIGRARETETLSRHLNGENGVNAMLLLAAPSAGASELLRQTYDRFFKEQQKIPFYFAFSRNDKTAKDCAVRFLQTFLLQVVAFRRSDANLLNVSPDVCEINELAAPSDAHWIHQLTTACRKESELNDERSFVRHVLSAPLRAAANAAPVVVILDDLQNAPAELIRELREIYAHSTVPFVFAGLRRFTLNAMQSGNANLNRFEILRLDALQRNNAELLTEKLAKKLEVKINEETRDLIVLQSGAKPIFIETLLTAAQKKGKKLENFQTFERIYTDELFGGQISRFYDSVFFEMVADSAIQKEIIKFLHEGLNAETETFLADIRREIFPLKDEDFKVAVNRLHEREFINFNSGAFYFSGEDEILNDYIEARYRLEILNESRALAVGGVLKKSLTRAPHLMARSYRRAAAIDLRELLSVFNCQSVPAILFDYEQFKKSNKEIPKTAENQTPTVKLPQIVYAANSQAFYPPISQVADAERSAVALGFEAGDYRQENEIVWIAAQIDSKLEAAKELIEFWCDRLEMIALMCDFSKYQLWLVTPEGFTAEALEVLRQRNAYGSSRKQFELLVNQLKAENVVRKKSDLQEYEMILPMDEDTELIAASAIEEVARRHHFAPKDITKIKTALVEAYINASEHSLSPDRKIYQKFSVENDKIVITISNRGVKLPSEKVAASVSPIEPDSGRRGWGLKLMRTLMDEVNFEQVDDGTRISMVKYLKSSQ